MNVLGRELTKRLQQGYQLGQKFIAALGKLSSEPLGNLEIEDHSS
jgi:hypothetical protein